ncbi:unnamed protein product [Didymodactylos carnosus]|uniref:G-protein coupled receptors family 1 profile domain-containing protein n=1 Tax=Didymodactylos carnosus TaxID=1234261 RepID=A0A814KF80_9BILA|nr:unnamed protein product [Didymodactylos carnosus]CAF1431264.1 unnamed protein product [Didymodactylos carnosus]CAF3820164.1 unnamed protein product [Didymodactylos carnosus]CAF4229367.1 unnamed protein product [Didymodactylos carnosus]
MNNMTDDKHLLDEFFTYYPLVLVIGGTLLNLLTFLIFCRPIFQNRPTMHYFRAMAVFDILMLYGWNLDHFLTSKYDYDLEHYSISTCKLFTFLNYFAAETSAWLRVCTCVDRLIALSSLNLYRTKINSHKTVLIIIFSTVLIIFLIDAHILIFTCYKTWDSVNNLTILKTGSTFYALNPMWDYVNLVLYNCIPFLLMSGFNSSIIYHLFQMKRTSMVQSKIQHRQITITLVIYTLLFSIMTIPGTIAYAFFLPKLENKVYRDWLLHLLDSILYTYHISSFFLYLITFKEFRQELIKIIKCDFTTNDNLADKHKSRTVISMTTK